jgi:flagellar biosynthesis/type III secretory pathway M-ring protein FliF/YscJ
MMFNQEMRELLLQVISAWQVWAVTAVVVIYFFIVSYVAKLYHRPRVSKSSAKKTKAEKAAAEPAQTEGSGGNDELGLEEE